MKKLFTERMKAIHTKNLKEQSNSKMDAIVDAMFAEYNEYVQMSEDGDAVVGEMHNDEFLQRCQSAGVRVKLIDEFEDGLRYKNYVYREV